MRALPAWTNRTNRESKQRSHAPPLPRWCLAWRPGRPRSNRREGPCGVCYPAWLLAARVCGLGSVRAHSLNHHHMPRTMQYMLGARKEMPHGSKSYAVVLSEFEDHRGKLVDVLILLLDDRLHRGVLLDDGFDLTLW